MVVTFWGFVRSRPDLSRRGPGIRDRGHPAAGRGLASSAHGGSREGSEDPEGVPGVAHLITIGGISLLDNSASLPNGRRDLHHLRRLRNAERRGSQQERILGEVRRRLPAVQDAIVFAVAPPAIQGLGVSGGFQMMLQLKGAGFDFPKIGQMAEELVRDGNAQSGPGRPEHVVPSGLPPGRSGGRPGQSGNRERFGGERVQHAAILSRLLLREPVQQIRPYLPGLRTGR